MIVEPVPNTTEVLEDNDQLIVPVQFEAVRTIGVLAQTLFAEAIIVRVIPTPPTFIVVCAVAAQVPVPQVTEYVVVEAGVTTVESVVAPFDHKIPPEQLLTVRVTGSLPQVLVFEANIVGV